MTKSDQVSKIYPPGQKVANIAPIAVKGSHSACSEFEE